MNATRITYTLRPARSSSAVAANCRAVAAVRYAVFGIDLEAARAAMR